MDLIVGAGITGLSYAAATSNDYLVIEKEPERRLLPDNSTRWFYMGLLRTFFSFPKQGYRTIRDG